MNEATQRQAGAVLIVALIVLVVLTMLGVAGVRGVALEERMASNTLDRNLAFQIAEAALREGERVALDQAKKRNAGFSASASSCDSPECSNGLCKPLPQSCATPLWAKEAPPASRNPESAPAIWQIVAEEDDTGLIASLGSLQNDFAPAYIVEHLGNTFPADPARPRNALVAKRYRITATSGGEGRAAVMLQSIYSAR